MASFLPSEIARLVLGYLKAEGCSKSYKTFLKESAYLAEYRTLLDQGKEFPTTIVGKSLTDMLEEYGQLKIQETNPASDVWCKFDKVVNQLRNVSNQRPAGPKPQNIATFQRTRGFYNANKSKRCKVQFIKNPCNADSEIFPGAVSMMSDPASSPGSNMGCDSPNSSSETQPNSSSETQKSVSLLQSIDGVQNSTGLTSSTPGCSQSDKSNISHSFPFQSPIVVSDSDHPFSPDSYPGTPGSHLHHQAIKLVQESPKSHHVPLKVSSPLLTRNENVCESPGYKLRNQSMGNSPAMTDYPRTEREQQILAMRTGVLSSLTKENVNKSLMQSFQSTAVDVCSLKNVIPLSIKSSDKIKIKRLQGNIKIVKHETKPLSKVSTGESTASKIENDIADSIPSSDQEDSLVIASPIKVSGEQENCMKVQTPSLSVSFTPSKSKHKGDDTLPFKTPVKAVFDGECSVDGFKTPKRKSQAPKRRSYDPNLSKESLVTPVKEGPLLSMPMFEELVNNTKFAEKLADTINTKLIKTENRRKTPLQSPAAGTCVNTPVKLNDDSKSSTTHEAKQKISQAVSPNCSNNLETIDLTSVNTSGIEGNESTGSIKPPLSNEELDSILEDTHMSENTIQGIINMTQNDPEFDALFSSLNVDKHEFIEKEYGISLSDYKLTPFKTNTNTSVESGGNASSSHAGSSLEHHSSHFDLLKGPALITSSSQNVSVSFSNMLTSSQCMNNSKHPGINNSNNNIQSSVDTIYISDDIQKQLPYNNNSSNIGHHFNEVPVSKSPETKLPTIHVQMVEHQKDTNTTNSQQSQLHSSGESFLQLLHSSTDSQQSYVETVQLLTSSANSHYTRGGTENSVPHADLNKHERATKVGDHPDRGKSDPTEGDKEDQTAHNQVEDNLESVGQDTTDSNGSEDAVLELPNGVKLSVLPAGADIDSQLQSLQTLTQLQKLLQSGFSLTPAGPAVTSTGAMGTSSVVTPVKLSSKPSGEGVTITTPSPGTTSMIQAVNTQQLCMIHPRNRENTYTVDTSGLGLITCPAPETTPKQPKAVSRRKKSSTGQKKGRGRPRTKAPKNVPTPEKKQELDVNVSVSVLGRIGMKDKRSEKRKNLGVPATVIVPQKIQEQTQGKPIVTMIDGKQVMLMPVVSTPEGACMLPKNAQNTENSTDDNRQIKADNTEKKGITLQDLLQTTMAENILGSKTVTSLASQQIKTDMISSASFSSAKKLLESDKAAEPSPTRRKLFGIESVTTPKNLLSAQRRVHLSQDSPSPCQKATTSIQSMGSMLLSPPGKKNVRNRLQNLPNIHRINSVSYPSEIQNPLAKSKPGVYIINKDCSGNILKNNSNTTLTNIIASSSDIQISGSDQAAMAKEPHIDSKEQNGVNNVFSMPADFDFCSGETVPNSISHIETHTDDKCTNKQPNNETINASDKLNSVCSNNLSCDVMQIKPINLNNEKVKTVNLTKPRRVELKKLPTVTDDDYKDSFQSAYPNIVSQKSLMSQPGNVEEIVSPTSLKTRTELEDSSRVSIVSAMQNIDESIDIETAQTMIKFAAKAYVTPKKIAVNDLDENSNPYDASNNETPVKDGINETSSNRTEMTGRRKREKKISKSIKSELKKSRNNVRSPKNKSVEKKGKRTKSKAKTTEVIGDSKNSTSQSHSTNSLNKATKGKKDPEDSTEVIVITSPTQETSRPIIISHAIEDSMGDNSEIIVINSPPGELNPQITQNRETLMNKRKRVKHDAEISDNKHTSKTLNPVTSPLDGVRGSTVKKNVKMSFFPSDSNIVTCVTKGSSLNCKRDITSKLIDKTSVKKSAKSKVKTTSVCEMSQIPSITTTVKGAPNTLEEKLSDTSVAEAQKTGRKDINEQKVINLGTSKEVCNDKESTFEKINSPLRPVDNKSNNSDNVTKDKQKLQNEQKTPEKQTIPTILKPGPSPYRSLSLAKLLEVGAKEMMTLKKLSTVKSSSATNPNFIDKDSADYNASSSSYKNLVKKQNSSNVTKRKFRDMQSDSPEYQQKKQKKSASNLLELDIDQAMKKIKKLHK